MYLSGLRTVQERRRAAHDRAVRYSLPAAAGTAQPIAGQQPCASGNNRQRGHSLASLASLSSVSLSLCLYVSVSVSVFVSVSVSVSGGAYVDA